MEGTRVRRPLAAPQSRAIRDLEAARAGKPRWSTLDAVKARVASPGFREQLAKFVNETLPQSRPFTPEADDFGWLSDLEPDDESTPPPGTEHFDRWCAKRERRLTNASDAAEARQPLLEQTPAPADQSLAASSSTLERTASSDESERYYRLCPVAREFKYAAGRPRLISPTLSEVRRFPFPNFSGCFRNPDDNTPTMFSSNNSTPTGYLDRRPRGLFTPSHPSSTGRTQSSIHSTPSRRASTRARSPLSTPAASQDMAEAFQLPDVNNLTALVGGKHQESAPLFSPEKKARWLQQAREYRDRHAAVQDVPVPMDERAIYASMCVLKEKVAQLEQERAAAEKRADDNEAEVVRLKSHMEAEERYRRSDSALGASDSDEGRGGSGLRAENTKLQAEIKAMQHRLDAANAKVAVKDITMKRCLSERDSVVTQLGAALINVDDLQKEVDALQKENETLRDELMVLRTENNDLHTEHVEIRREIGRTDVLTEENENLRNENTELRRNARKSERAVSENAFLKEQLESMRTQHSQETQEIQFREGDARRKAERKIQKALNEQYQLQIANDQLRHQLGQAKQQQMSTQARLQELDETTRSINLQVEDLRQKNDQLRATADHEALLQQELSRVVAKHDEHSAQWAQMENELKAEIERLQRSGRVGDRSSATQPHEPPQKRPTRQPRATPVSPSKPKLRNSPTKTKLSSRGINMNLDFQDRRSSAPAMNKTPRQTSGLTAADATTDLDLSVIWPGATTAERKRKEEQKRQALSAVEKTSLPTAMRTQRLSDKRSYEGPRQDVTLLSAMDTAEIAAIRKELEEERRTRRAPQPDERSTNFKLDASEVAAIRRQVEEESRVARPSDGAEPKDLREADATAYSQFSVASQPTTTRRSTKVTARDVTGTNETRRHSAPEMTSAFILPDITMSIPPAAADSRPSLSHGARAQELLKDRCPHNSKDCTVCYRFVSSSSLPGERLPSAPKIPTPVPVSEIDHFDEDVTTRPATPPVEALARVLKELEDELTHDKRDLVLITQILQKHNAALGSRKREHYTRKVSFLNEAVATKSRHIYDLHDVLEGQKAAGQLSSVKKAADPGADHQAQEQVEETLMSIGFEPEEARQRASRGKKVVVKSVSSSASSDAGY